MGRNVSEPVVKMTEVCWPELEDLREQEHPGSAKSTARAAGLAVRRGPSSEKIESALGTKTVRRWSADMLEHGKGLNKPRLFDSIKPPYIGPRDMEELDLTSSMEPVRTAAL